MLTLSKLIAVIPTVMIVGCASGPSGQSFDSPIGEWNETLVTMSGENMSLKVTIIDKTRGLTSRGVLEFFSADNDRMWKAYWIDDSGLEPCSEKKNGSPYWGESIYHFNEAYNRYSGTYDVCGEGRKYDFNGYR